MSETIKTGGEGKSPAIEKINQINAISNRLQASAELEKKAFQTESSRAKRQLARRKQIIDELNISFKR